MTSESLPPTHGLTIHPMVPYKRPKELVLPRTGASDTYSPRQYLELGDRLNIDREALASGLAHDSSDAYELKHSPKGKTGVEVAMAGTGDEGVRYRMESESEMGAATLAYPHSHPLAQVSFSNDAPPFVFAPARRSRLFSEMPSLPAVMARLKSPFDASSPGSQASEETKVYVTTHQTVERE